MVKTLSKFYSKIERVLLSLLTGTVISILFMIILKEKIISANTVLVVIFISAIFYAHRRLIEFQHMKKLNTTNVLINEFAETNNQDDKIRLCDTYKKMYNDMKVIIYRKNTRITELEEKERQFLQLFRSMEGKLANQEENYNTFNSIIFELSSGVDTQVKSVKDTSKAMEEIASGVQQIAETSGVASSSSIAASQTAQEGKTEITSVINQMNKIDTSFSTLSNTVKGFQVSTKEIGSIIEEISNIANQTNLLSLNASIEAARAGNEGKGFAVVANEVGKLSKQSNEFAEKISELIKAIQSQAETANEAMAISKRDVVSGLHIVENASKSFQSIIQVTDTINEQIHEISYISQELAAGSEQVSASTAEITEISKKSSDAFNIVIPIIIDQFDMTNTISNMVEENFKKQT